MRQNICLAFSCTRPFSSLPRYRFSRTFIALGVILGSGRSAGIVVLICVLAAAFAFATILLSPLSSLLLRGLAHGRRRVEGRLLELLELRLEVRGVLEGLVD